MFDENLDAHLQKPRVSPIATALSPPARLKPRVEELFHRGSNFGDVRLYRCE
jgi:hypothetical protein